jgi:hypothetical protein
VLLTTEPSLQHFSPFFFFFFNNTRLYMPLQYIQEIFIIALILFLYWLGVHAFIS